MKLEEIKKVFVHRETKRITKIKKAGEELEEDEERSILDDDSVLPMIQCDVCEIIEEQEEQLDLNEEERRGTHSSINTVDIDNMIA